MKWTSDITNNPNQGYDLCIELWEGNEHRGYVLKNKDGEIILQIFAASNHCIEIPGKWLRSILERAEGDL